MWYLEKADDYNTMVKIWAHYQKEFKPYRGYDMTVSLSQNSRGNPCYHRKSMEMTVHIFI